jgi:hypothetical protein
MCVPVWDKQTMKNPIAMVCDCVYVGYFGSHRSFPDCRARLWVTRFQSSKEREVMFATLQQIKVLLTGLIVIALCTTVLAQSAGSQPGLQITKGVQIVRSNVHHDVSPPLADLIKMRHDALSDSLQEREAEPVRPIPLPPGFKPEAEPDPVHQKTTLAAPEVSVMGLSFEGLGNGIPGFNVLTAPPDTNGAAGLTQYVQWVNSTIAVFDKSTGAIVAGPANGNVFWTGFGGDCETTNDGDPIVLYDKLANRWVLSQFAVHGSTPPFLQCVAVSTTSDVTGSFFRYSFQYSNLDDYPKMGVWPDAYYVTFKLFASPTGPFLGAEACAYDRIAMLNGLAATQMCVQPGTSVSSLLPSDVDGGMAPPTGSPNYMIFFGANSLKMFKFHVDFATPGNSTFTGPTIIPVAAFTPLCNGLSNCVPQPNTTQKLDSLADRLMYRLAYRNFGNHESLVVNQSVAVNSNSGIRWYELQNPNGTVTVVQQSTFAPDTDFRWMGSIAMDRVGDMAVGYSVSSTTTSPSIAITGRTPSNPANTMQVETTVVSGSGSQISGPGPFRWGDYSAMQVDPVDDCTFWYTTEYMKTTGSAWNTRIASFKFPNCGLSFVPVTPCRVVDTRNPIGPFGGPFISGGSSRGFAVPSSSCGIPANAQAYSINSTVVPKAGLGFLTMFPCAQSQPLVSTLNSIDGRVKAAASIVPAGVNGGVCAFATNDTDLVIDINGYFVPSATPNALAFYPVTPCRLVDTRGPTGALGGPSLIAGAARTFPVLSSTCNLPGTAQAYSLNYTSVPRLGGLGFLTTWPAGQSQPLVSTLNAPTGAVTANGAIVPAGTNGGVSVFVSNDSDLVIDVNGYFAPPGVGGLSFFTQSPCRVLDTRNSGGTPFNGTASVNVAAGGCGTPASAQSYVLNATVVPPAGLGFLTLWPQGAAQPLVSTLNAIDGAITSNMAIIPTTNGSISAFAANPTHLILDISGYFAP